MTMDAAKLQYRPLRVVQVLASLYPNFCKIGEDGVLELYCDNTMLSSFRKCQGYFQETYLSKPGKTLVPKEREWSLEFGIYVHKCLEYFYTGQRDNWEGKFYYFNNATKQIVEEPQDFGKFLQICMFFWKKYNMDFFRTSQNGKKQFEKLGGMAGAILLFKEYFQVHYRNERLRHVGWELSFGKNKEVPIVQSELFRGYYCGRIDNIVDNGTIIGPMDTKTKAYFDGTETDSYKPDEGPEGYVYSWQQMIPESLKAMGRQCNSMIINHISVQAVDNMQERFKRSVKPYTPAELQEWLGRQATTFGDIYNLLMGNRIATWNTALCNMWFYKRKCPFKNVHEVPPSFRENLIKLNYTEKEAWSPERTVTDGE